MQTMNGLFLHFLKDMYHAEQQTLRTFPRMMSAVQSQALKQADAFSRLATGGVDQAATGQA